MCAVGGFVHAVSFLQQLEELLDGDTGVRRAAQREDLPHQDTEGPPEQGPEDQGTSTFSFVCSGERTMLEQRCV